MTPRDLFGVVVRSIAAIAFGYALWNLSFGIMMRVGIMRDLEGSATDWLGSGFALLLAASVMLLAAPLIVSMAYGLRIDDAPRPRPPEDEPDNATNAGEPPSEGGP